MKRALIALFAASAILIGCRGGDPPVAVGTLERHRIELRAERQEPILRLAVKEGDRVEVGDVVAELDSRRIIALRDRNSRLYASSSEAAAVLLVDSDSSD